TVATRLSLVLTPHGRLLLEESLEGDAAPLLDGDLARRLQDAFASGHGHGLLQLGAAEVQTAMPAAFAYWREFAARYVIVIRTLGALPAAAPPVPEDLIFSLVASPPLMKGGEYLTF